MAENVAKRILDPEARLKQELEYCPFITGIEREWLATCLRQMGIQSLERVDLQVEMRYRAIVWKDAEIEASKKTVLCECLGILCAILSKDPAGVSGIAEGSSRVWKAQPSGSE